MIFVVSYAITDMKVENAENSVNLICARGVDVGLPGKQSNCTRDLLCAVFYQMWSFHVPEYIYIRQLYICILFFKPIFLF